MTTVLDLYKILFGRKGIQDGNVIEMAEHGRAGGVQSGQPFKFVDGLDYTIKITESGDNTYVAFANPGTLESAASWKAFKMDSSAGLRLTFADGNQSFDNVATDLTALDYS